jgi:predicted ATP-binding protein involved in virulence
MIFPYIKQIHVNTCYTYNNFDIPKKSRDTWKHLIITGKNGSGKTTILRSIAHILQEFRSNRTPDIWIEQLKGRIQANPGHVAIPEWQKNIEDLQKVRLTFYDDVVSNSLKDDLSNVDNYIFSFFRANRKVELNNVDTVTKEDVLLSALKEKTTGENLTAQFKQFLVNKKVYEAFDYINERAENIRRSNEFFKQLENIFQLTFKDKDLKLLFEQENFEFFLLLGDGRKITFNQLSAGFSAFLSIFMDISIKDDLLRKRSGDYQLQSPGIVLIDEPETHTHLSMQYEVLPLINEYFPNIQLIVATHSPAIISSLKNSVVYDLSSQSEVSDWLLGSSFSELMISHFGLDNEFSPVADKIILDVQAAVQQKNKDQLENILFENSKYLTPSLRLEIESQIAEIVSRSHND